MICAINALIETTLHYCCDVSFDEGPFIKGVVLKQEHWPTSNKLYVQFISSTLNIIYTDWSFYSSLNAYEVFQLRGMF